MAASAKNWKSAWAHQHADVQAFAGGGVPGVIASASAGELLIGEVDRAVGCTAAGGFHCVGVGGASDGREVELAGKDGAGERGFEGGEIE